MQTGEELFKMPNTRYRVNGKVDKGQGSQAKLFFSH